MSPERIDLNLLRVFDAVYEDQNLLRASKRLNLTQSAVSHALARLRKALQDELFVRTPKGMEPTARAVTMAMPLREALQRIRETLGFKEFVPEHAKRSFVIAANDYVTSVLLHRLSQRLAGEAPQADLVIRASTRLDLAAQIDMGRIDLAISTFAEVPVRFQSSALWSQEEVIVIGRGHPAARRKLVLEDLARYPLVTVSLGGEEEGAVGGFIVERGLARQSEMFGRQALEDALARAGVAARVRITVPHSLAIPNLLRDSDMLALVPAPLAQDFVRQGHALIKRLPYPTSSVTLHAVWHRRLEHDPAHVWLRSLVGELARELESASRERDEPRSSTT